MTPGQAFAAQQSGGKRLVLAGAGLLIAAGGFVLLALGFIDGRPDKDTILAGAAVAGGGLFFSGIGLFGAGKHTSGIAVLAAIFALLGGIGLGAGTFLATEESSAKDVLLLLGAANASGAFSVFLIGLWGAVSKKALGGLGMAGGILGILAGLAGTGFWVGVLAEALKLSHVSEAVPAVIGGLALPCLLLALRGFGKTKPLQG